MNLLGGMVIGYTLLLLIVVTIVATIHINNIKRIMEEKKDGDEK